MLVGEVQLRVLGPDAEHPVQERRITAGDEPVTIEVGEASFIGASERKRRFVTKVESHAANAI